MGCGVWVTGLKVGDSGSRAVGLAFGVLGI